MKKFSVKCLLPFVAHAPSTDQVAAGISSFQSLLLCIKANKNLYSYFLTFWTKGNILSVLSSTYLYRMVFSYIGTQNMPSFLL